MTVAESHHRNMVLPSLTPAWGQDATGKMIEISVFTPDQSAWPFLHQVGTGIQQKQVEFGKTSREASLIRIGSEHVLVWKRVEPELRLFLI